MVGVVGSSPIAPTIDRTACAPFERTRDKSMVMTPLNVQGDLLAKRELARPRCSIVFEKVRHCVRTFFLESQTDLSERNRSAHPGPPNSFQAQVVSDPTLCPTSDFPTAPSRHFDAAGHRRRGRRVHRPRPRQGGARRQGRRQAGRHVVPHRPRRRARHRHRQGRRTASRSSATRRRTCSPTR